MNHRAKLSLLVLLGFTGYVFAGLRQFANANPASGGYGVLAAASAIHVGAILLLVAVYRGIERMQNRRARFLAMGGVLAVSVVLTAAIVRRLPPETGWSVLLADLPLVPLVVLLVWSLRQAKPSVSPAS